MVKVTPGDEQGPCAVLSTLGAAECGGSESRLWSQAAWVHISGLTLSMPVTLGKALSLSESGLLISEDRTAVFPGSPTR